jgi:hypothetical protein
VKTCTKCGVEKAESAYFKYSGRPGLRPSCKECMRKVRPADNPETRKAWLRETVTHRSTWQKEYYAKNKTACADRVKASRAKKIDQYSTYRKQWVSENPERLRELAREHRKANPDMYREYKVRRRLAETRATPVWANIDAIRAWYTFASVTPGVHVDHIVPLNSPIVCGLHCEFNLQLLPANENMSKGNRHWPDMPDFM